MHYILKVNPLKNDKVVAEETQPYCTTDGVVFPMVTWITVVDSSSKGLRFDSLRLSGIEESLFILFCLCPAVMSTRGLQTKS